MLLVEVQLQVKAYLCTYSFLEVTRRYAQNEPEGDYRTYGLGFLPMGTRVSTESRGLAVCAAA